MGGHGNSEPQKMTAGGIVIRILQYLIGTIVSSLAIFYEFNGVFNNYAHVTVEMGWPSWLVFLLVVILVTVLAYCEATQVALMILEKVDSADLGEGWLMDYAKRAHALAKSNVNNYLIGRQTFVTCIVMMTAELIHLDHSYIPYCFETLGPIFGSETLVSIFVRSGLCGSLILLAFGQLIPELTVTTNPTFMFRLPPAYEIIWLNMWCERLGICQFSEILASLTRWAIGLKDDDMFAAGSETKISAGGSEADGAVPARDDPESEEYKLRNAYFPSLFRNPIPGWWLGLKYIVGCSVMAASTFGMIWYVMAGGSPWCPKAVPYCNVDEACDPALPMEQAGSMAGCEISKDDWDWEAANLHGIEKQTPAGFDAPVCAGVLTWSSTGRWDVGSTTYPDFHYEDATSENKVRVYNDWALAKDKCICPQLVLLLVVVPLMSILLMFLEGSQIAVLALEKAPGRQIKRMHRPAYFGHKISQVRDNVRRYLLGRQFLVVFGDFVAAKCYGMAGIGYIVIIEVYPRLVALKNPMYWLGTWGSRFVLLLAILIEFLGFTHFAWGLYIMLDFCLKKCCGVTDDSFSVGAEVNVGDENKEDSLLERAPEDLIEIIYGLRERLEKYEPKKQEKVEAAKDDDTIELEGGELKAYKQGDVIALDTGDENGGTKTQKPETDL